MFDLIEKETIINTTSRPSEKTSTGIDMDVIDSFDFDRSAFRVLENTNTANRSIHSHFITPNDTSARIIPNIGGRRIPTNTTYRRIRRRDQLTAMKLVDKIERLLKENEIDESIYLIFKEIDSWLIKYNTNRVSYLFSYINKIELNEDILVAILSSTLTSKPVLPSRGTFYDKVYRQLMNIYDNKKSEVDYMLSGLK